MVTSLESHRSGSASGGRKGQANLEWTADELGPLGEIESRPSRWRSLESWRDRRPYFRAVIFGRLEEDWTIVLSQRRRGYRSRSEMQH